MRNMQRKEEESFYFLKSPGCAEKTCEKNGLEGEFSSPICCREFLQTFQTAHQICLAKWVSVADA